MADRADLTASFPALVDKAFRRRHCCLEGNRPHGGQVVRLNSTESRAASGPFGALGEEDLSRSHVSDRTAKLNATVPFGIVESVYCFARLLG